jgi:acyl-CoA hydrolase
MAAMTGQFRLQSVNEAIDAMPAGSSVVASPACGTPTTLVNALAARSDGREWTLSTGLLFAHEMVARAVERGALSYVTWHVTAALEPLFAQGKISYVPLRASRVPAFLAAHVPDVALVRVTPPDRHGWCSVGPSVSYVRAALDFARVRIAEVDPKLPRTCGESLVHVDDLDVLVEATDALPVYEAAAPNAVSEAIAGHIIALLPEAPLLQLGIGTVPEALVAELAHQGVGDLRFTGMGSDGMVDLDERGLLERRHRGSMPPISAPDLLGTSRLMEWADENASVGVYPSTFAQNPIALSARERLVSINSAIEIDLAGQVNAERVRGRQISGLGGSIDFVEAATHSNGGLRVIALPSTTTDGSTSRVVPRLGEASGVTLPAALVDVVVTEHGMARLEGLSTRERAEALVAVAAPQHRDGLLELVR